MTDEKMSLLDNVYTGMKYLDGISPGWEKKIDLEELNMHNESKCILGQLFGDAYKGFRNEDDPDYDGSYGLHHINYRPYKDHGFMNKWHRGTELTEVWKEAILERLIP
jgi:hypothetical protein